MTPHSPFPSLTPRSALRGKPLSGSADSGWILNYATRATLVTRLNAKLREKFIATSSKFLCVLELPMPTLRFRLVPAVVLEFC